MPVPRSAFDESRLPAHLRVTFRVVDHGQVLASGKDLAGLRRQLRPRLQETLTEAARGLTRTGLRTWDLESLPREFSACQVRGYPALADAGDVADIRLFETEAEAQAAMRQGTRRLLLLAVPSGARAVASRLPVGAKLAMSRHPYRSTDALLDDCAAAAADQIVADAGGPAWDGPGFAKLLDAARDRLAAVTADVVSRVARILAETHGLEASLAGKPAPVLAPAVADLRGQLSGLIHPGFIAETGAARLPDLLRYLQGMSRRLEKMPESPVPGRRADGRGAAGGRGLPAGPRRPAAIPTAGAGGPGGAVDDRGTAGQPVRPDPRHPGPRLRAAHHPCPAQLRDAA